MDSQGSVTLAGGLCGNGDILGLGKARDGWAWIHHLGSITNAGAWVLSPAVCSIWLQVGGTSVTQVSGLFTTDSRRSEKLVDGVPGAQQQAARCQQVSRELVAVSGEPGEGLGFRNGKGFGL